MQAGITDTQTVQYIAGSEEEQMKLGRHKFFIDFSEKFSSYTIGEEFFNSLVQFIAGATSLDYVLIGKFHDNMSGGEIETIAVNAFGNPADNFTYTLPDGPCEQVIRGTLYCYPQQCRISFPKNETIVQFNAEGYIGYPLFDAKGKAFGLVAVMHQKPITDTDFVAAILKVVAKRAEFEMERMIYEKELKALNLKLVEKNRQLEIRNKELTSFAYVASHDLQEPFRKIQAFSNRIADKESKNLSSTSRDYFERMQQAAGRAQKLIHDLLLYSRVNMAESELEPTDLNEIIEQVRDDLSESISQTNTTIRAGKLPILPVVEFQIVQLFNNLLSNAIKFARPGMSPEILIDSKEVAGDEVPLKSTGKFHHISITDNGIGFDKQFSSQIFTIFKRLHRKEEYSGTGIGLAICRKIVDNHHGYICAESNDDGGATFSVYLPAGEPGSRFE